MLINPGLITYLYVYAESDCMKIKIKVPAVRLRGPGGPPQQGVLRGRVRLPCAGVGGAGGRGVHHRVRADLRGEEGECVRGRDGDQVRGRHVNNVRRRVKYLDKAATKAFSLYMSGQEGGALHVWFAATSQLLSHCC